MAAIAPQASMSQSLEYLALQIASLSFQCSSLLKASQSVQLTTENDSPEAAAARASLPTDLRNQLAEAALDLWNLTIGPEERVRRLAIDWSIPSALRYIVHFGIPDIVPQSGEISYTDLATAAKVPEAHLKRIIRLAGTAGIFTEMQSGYVSHTALSIRLSSAYPELSNYAAHCLEFSFPVTARMPEMSEQWSGSEEKSHTAFNVAYNTKEPLFKWLQHEPSHALRFGKLMGAMRKNPSWDVKHLVEGWKGWEELEKGSKVVDVGGSLGHASIALAEKYNSLDFVVQDLGYVIAQAKEMKTVPEVLDGRVQLMEHDFFTEQPVKDADVYLMRQILHDWADDSALKILRGLVPALQKKGARVLIMDQVVPTPGTLYKSQEREARTVDLVVMSHFNGKQRDLEGWKDLVQTADQRLEISQVVQPSGSHFAIIEVVLRQIEQTKQADALDRATIVEKDYSLDHEGDPFLAEHKTLQDVISPLDDGTRGPQDTAMLRDPKELIHSKSEEHNTHGVSDQHGHAVNSSSNSVPEPSSNANVGLSDAAKHDSPMQSLIVTHSKLAQSQDQSDKINAAEGRLTVPIDPPSIESSSQKTATIALHEQDESTNEMNETIQTALVT